MLAGALKFTDEEMHWLRMIKDHTASSVHLDIDDLGYIPFDKMGGRRKCGSCLVTAGLVISELTEILAA